MARVETRPAVVQVVEPESFVLTLNREEAEWLITIAGKIGGTGAGRKVFSDTDNSIYELLESAGIVASDSKRNSIRRQGATGLCIDESWGAGA